MGRFGSSSLATLPLGFKCGFIPTLHVGHPLGVAPEAALEDLGLAPVRARCGNGAAAWVAGVLAEPGTQGVGGLEARAAGNIVLWKGMATSIGQYAPVFLPGEAP